MRKLLWMILIVGVPVAAQPPGPAQDTSSAAGIRDGRRDAGNVAVAGRGLAGFAGGLSIGFFAPFAIFGANPIAMGVTGAGGAGVIAAAESGGKAPPDSVTARALLRGSGYTSGFAQGYSEMLQSRRRKAAYLGGLGGTAVGFGALMVLIVAALGSD